jgi:outer membrane lipoprotein-sorting protein
MTPRRRWSLVILSAVVLAAIPVAVTSWPADGSDLSASALTTRIRASASVAFSGYIETEGSLQVPDSSSFAGVAQLLGESNQIRAWWRGPDDWRVDRVFPTGETDLFRSGGRSIRWSYESATATVSPVSTIRLPDASDLLPSTLARQMLQGATSGEVARLGSRRIAGHSAAGLRLTPSDAASTIGRVDIWADASSGLPLEVRLYDSSGDRPVVTTRMRDLSIGRPSAATVHFDPPGNIKIRYEQAIDVAAGANAFSPFVAPATLAGFSHRAGAPDVSAVGVYGRGPTSFLALPLRRSVSVPLRKRLASNAAATVGPGGTTLRVGPLTLLLTPGRRGGSFLLAGTVTPTTLQQAAEELAALPNPGRPR